MPNEDNQMTKVTLFFPTESTADAFLAWLSDQGEQDMSCYMEVDTPELNTCPSYDCTSREVIFELNHVDGFKG